MPAVADELRVGLRRSVADAAWRHFAADGELQLRSRRERASLGRAGAPEVRGRRVRVLRAGQLARQAEPDRHRRDRYSLYSPPWEINGLQVAPTVSLGQWFDTRVANMKNGIPDNALPPLQLDLAGPANDRKGFYDWDKNNFGPRIAVAWSPHAQGRLPRR